MGVVTEITWNAIKQLVSWASIKFLLLLIVQYHHRDVEVGLGFMKGFIHFWAQIRKNAL